MLTRRKLLIASGLAGLVPAWRRWAKAPGKVWRIGVTIPPAVRLRADEVIE